MTVIFNAALLVLFFWTHFRCGRVAEAIAVRKHLDGRPYSALGPLGLVLVAARRAPAVTDTSGFTARLPAAGLIVFGRIAQAGVASLSLAYVCLLWLGWDDVKGISPALLGTAAVGLALGGALMSSLVVEAGDGVLRERRPFRRAEFPVRDARRLAVRTRRVGPLTAYYVGTGEGEGVGFMSTLSLSRAGAASYLNMLSALPGA